MRPRGGRSHVRQRVRMVSDNGRVGVRGEGEEGWWRPGPPGCGVESTRGKAGGDGVRPGLSKTKIKFCPQVGGVAKMAEPDSQPCLGHGIKASLGLTPLQGWRGERRRPLGLWLKQPGGWWAIHWAVEEEQPGGRRPAEGGASHPVSNSSCTRAAGAQDRGLGRCTCTPLPVAEGDRGALRNRCSAWRCMYTCPHLLIPPSLSHFLHAPPSLLPTQGGATAKVRMEGGVLLGAWVTGNLLTKPRALQHSER